MDRGKKGSNKNNSGTHTQLSVRLSNDLLERIENYAESERRNRSNAIEYLLLQALEEKK